MISERGISRGMEGISLMIDSKFFFDFRASTASSIIIIPFKSLFFLQPQRLKKFHILSSTARRPWVRFIDTSGSGLHITFSAARTFERSTLYKLGHVVICRIGKNFFRGSDLYNFPVFHQSNTISQLKCLIQIM